MPESNTTHAFSSRDAEMAAEAEATTKQADADATAAEEETGRDSSLHPRSHHAK
jgi:hypothetical protein